MQRQKSEKSDSDGYPMEVIDEDNTGDDVIACDVQSNEGTMRKRQKHLKKRAKSRIIRSIWFNKESHPEKHYRELLMLFTAWRNEDSDLLGE